MKRLWKALPASVALRLQVHPPYFPFRNCSNLQGALFKNQLETVMFKGLTVHELKTSVSSTLQKIDAKLFAANSVAMAIADVFSKNGHTVPNEIAKIFKIFDRLETPKSRWVIP